MFISSPRFGMSAHFVDTNPKVTNQSSLLFKGITSGRVIVVGTDEKGTLIYVARKAGLLQRVTRGIPAAVQHLNALFLKSTAPLPGALTDLFMRYEELAKKNEAKAKELEIGRASCRERVSSPV